MNRRNKVSKNIFIISILLSLVAVVLGAYAAYKEEYVIAGAMLFVLVLQIHNILTYKRQHGK